MKPTLAFRNFLIIFSGYLLFGGAFFYCLTGTLDDMTRSDCAHGVQSACEALK